MLGVLRDYQMPAELLYINSLLMRRLLIQTGGYMSICRVGTNVNSITAINKDYERTDSRGGGG